MIKPEDIKIKRLFHKYQFFISAKNVFDGVFEMPALAEFDEKELKLVLLKQIYADIVSESVARLREIEYLFMMSRSVYAEKGKKETRELIGCLQNLLQIDYKHDVSFGDRKCL